MRDDPELLVSEFFQRLEELESLAREITGRLQVQTPAPPPAPRRERPFELVVLCTGNRVRSPVAEGFLRLLLEGMPVRLSSAGMLDLGPVPALPETLSTAAELGLDLESHRAQCVLGADLSHADAVIGFEQRHVATAVVDANAPRDRTFTMIELVQLLERVLPPAADEPAKRAREAMARAAALRQGRLEPPPELADPLGGSQAVYRTTIQRVRDLSERLAISLFGAENVNPLPVIAADAAPRRRMRIVRDA
jgi:low molecular weight protein-tyrosine phosphatase